MTDHTEPYFESNYLQQVLYQIRRSFACVVCSQYWNIFLSHQMREACGYDSPSSPIVSANLRWKARRNDGEHGGM